MCVCVWGSWEAPLSKKEPMRACDLVFPCDESNGESHYNECETWYSANISIGWGWWVLCGGGEVIYLHHFLQMGGILFLLVTIPVSISWNYCNSDGSSSHHEEKSIWSYERFFSSNASVAMNLVRHETWKIQPHSVLELVHLIWSCGPSPEVHTTQAIATPTHHTMPPLFHLPIIFRLAMASSQRFCQEGLQLGQRRSFSIRTHWACHLRHVNPSTSFWRHLARMQSGPPMHGTWWL